VGLSLLENNRKISAARPYLQVHFEYVAEGRTFGGATRLDTLTRAVYRAVPKDVIDLLHAKGYMSFADLPADIQAMLRRRGIETLEAVPEPLLEALRAQGVKSVKDFPTDVRALSPHASENLVPAGPMVSSTSSAQRAGAVAPVESGAIIQVRYDPGDPARHAIARFPRVRGAAWPALLGVFAVITVLYCGLFYPRVKQF